MIEILKMNRMRKLMQQYANLKKQALDFMKAGDIQNYIDTLTQAQKIKGMYLSTARTIALS